jgi:hypothetical protein
LHKPPRSRIVVDMHAALRGSILLGAALSMAGCGLVESDFDAKVTVTFKLDATDNTYSNTVLYDLDSEPDIRDNRDRLRDGSGQVSRLQVTLSRIPAENLATFGWGEAYLWADGQPEPEETEDNVLASFSGVPIEEGVVFRMDVNPDQRVRLSKLVFENSKINVKFRGGTDAGPVKFDAAVDLFLEFTAGL